MKTFECAWCGNEKEETDTSPRPIVSESGPFKGERYCSRRCLLESVALVVMDESRAERRQMGLTAL
jgi:hypothetical protein